MELVIISHLELAGGWFLVTLGVCVIKIKFAAQ